MFRVFRLISFVQKHDNSSVIGSTEMILVASIPSNTSLYTNTGRALNGRETERLVSRFPGLMDRQVNIRIANSPQRNYRRIRRPRWPTPFHEEITRRNQSTEPNRYHFFSLFLSLSLSFSPLHTCLPIRPFDLFSSSLSFSLSFEKR